MGLSSNDLWLLSRAQYDALRRQWERAREREAWRHAEVLATLYNAHFYCQCDICQSKAKANRNRHHEPYTPAMFMPGYKPRPQTVEEQMQNFQAFVERMGGTPQQPGTGTIEERLAAAREKWAKRGVKEIYGG